MRRLLVPLVAFAFAAVALAAESPKPAPDKVPDKSASAADHKMPKDTCVAECMACAKECLDCMKYCNDKGNKPNAAMCDGCHHACMMCGVLVGAKLHGSWEACETCEKICNECAAMCEKGDERVKKCAEECRKCAKACAEARK